MRADATAGQCHMHVTDGLWGHKPKVRVCIQLEDQQDLNPHAHTIQLTFS